MNGLSCGCMQGVVGLDNFGIQGSVNLLATGIKGVVEIGTVGMQGSVGIICTPNTDAYLRVSPEVIWLTPDMDSSGVFTVKANVRWEILLEKQEEDEQVVGILTNGSLITNDTMLINGVTVSILANSVNIDNNTLLMN